MSANRFYFNFVTTFIKVTMENIYFDFVANAFHELKSPLTTIMLVSEIIMKQEFDNISMQRCLSMIYEEAGRMKSIVNNTINSLKNNYFNIDVSQKCDINEILERVVVSEDLGDIDLSLAAEQHFVRGNAEYFESAFREIIENARKYKSERPLRISIETINRGGDICLCFSDNGVGVDKYYYSDNQQSTGVGLYLLRKKLLQLNGSVTAERRDGGGSVFKITLPIIV